MCCAIGHSTVEMAGIEPAATTLAGRVRYLSCHPRGRCGARYSRSPGVAGLSSAASLSFGRRGGLPIMVLTLWICQPASTFTLGWCSAGTAGVEPAFRSGWSRVAYPVADPQVNENRPSGIPGAAAFSWLNGLRGNRPGYPGQADAARTGSYNRLASWLSRTSRFDGKRYAH